MRTETEPPSSIEASTHPPGVSKVISSDATRPRSRANTAMQRIPLPHCPALEPSALKIATPRSLPASSGRTAIST